MVAEVCAHTSLSNNAYDCVCLCRIELNLKCRTHALKILIRPIKAMQNQPKRVTPIKEVQNQLCQISRSLPRHCILAFLWEPKRITLVHLYHTWCVCVHKFQLYRQTMSMFSVCLLTTELNLNCRKHTLKKLIGSNKDVRNQLYRTRLTRNCILAITQ